jgi:NitT/TauT family transport system substrate-binding protein
MSNLRYNPPGFASFAAALGLTACALAGAAAQGAPPLKVWRHGIIEAKSDAGIFYMATKRPIAASLGLKLDFVQIKNDSLGLKALIAGELDSYEGGAGGAMTAASRGADVKLVGCNWLTVPHGIYVRGNTITSVADLKGKAIAISAPGSFPDIFARAAFAKAGIPVADLKFATMGSDTDRYKALLAGIVDAAVITNEFVPLAPKEGLKDLLPAAEVTPDLLRVCLHMTGRTLASRRDDAVRFLAAEIEGLRYAMSHRDETIKVAHDITSAKPDDPRAGFVFDAAVRTNAVAPNLPILMDKLAYMEKQEVIAGNIVKPIDLEKMVDHGAREAALALLAK